MCWWPSSPREFHQIVGMHRNHQIVGYELVHRKLYIYISLYYCDCLFMRYKQQHTIFKHEKRLSNCILNAARFFAAFWVSRRCFMVINHDGEHGRTACAKSICVCVMGETWLEKLVLGFNWFKNNHWIPSCFLQHTAIGSYLEGQVSWISWTLTNAVQV